MASNDFFFYYCIQMGSKEEWQYRMCVNARGTTHAGIPGAVVAWPNCDNIRLPCCQSQ